MAGESAYESARRQRDKAARLIRAAELNEQGAHGEEQTAAALAALPPDQWTVIHDVRWPGRRYANIDHVAIGPSGVFVIDSKNWSGAITVSGNVLRQNGYRREPAITSAADSAAALSALVPLLRPDLVQPVLCFVRQQPLTAWARGVRVCSTSTLVTMLRSQPNHLIGDEVRAVAAHLHAQLRSATAPPLPARAVATPRARSTTKRRPRRKSGVAPALVGLAAAGLLAFQPQVVMGAGQQVAELVIDVGR